MEKRQRSRTRKLIWDYFSIQAIMDNLICCAQCLELVDYEDAVYEDDDAKDDSMICIECYLKKIKVIE